MVREGLQSGTRIDLLSVFLHEKYIHSYNFYLSGFVKKFLNFCVTYFPSWFLKMAVILSHSHFLHVAFVSIMVFQTFDRMMFGTLTFPGSRWYVLTVRDPQMVRNQKKLGIHCFRHNKWHDSSSMKSGRKTALTKMWQERWPTGFGYIITPPANSAQFVKERKKLKYKDNDYLQWTHQNWTKTSQLQATCFK